MCACRQSNRVGPENEGWTVAKYLLEFERGGGGASARLKIGLGELRAIAQRQLDGDGAALADDAAFAARVDQLEIRMMALEFAETDDVRAARRWRLTRSGIFAAEKYSRSISARHSKRCCSKRSTTTGAACESDFAERTLPIRGRPRIMRRRSPRDI